MPIYKGRREGTYRVTVWSGTKQTEWIVEGTRRDAARFERQKQNEFSVRSVTAARAALTFVTFCESEYEPYAKGQFGVSTWKRTRKYTVARLIEFFGTARLDRIETSDVERYKRERQSEGMLPASINAELKALKSMLRWAREDLKIPAADPVIKMLKKPDGRAIAWTSDEVRRLYASLLEVMPHLVPMIRFLLNTGCRKGEVIVAEWSWVDFDRAMLRIPSTRYWRPKSGKAREVPIDSILPMLRELPRGDAPQIFLSLRGTPFAEFPQKQFTEARRHAKLGGSPHTTRHTYASHFLASRPDMGLLARVLGHSATRVTEIYAHMLPGHLEQARGAVAL